VKSIHSKKKIHMGKVKILGAKTSTFRFLRSMTVETVRIPSWSLACIDNMCSVHQNVIAQSNRLCLALAERRMRKIGKQSEFETVSISIC
jgi:hypothetical protein